MPIDDTWTPTEEVKKYFNAGMSTTPYFMASGGNHGLVALKEVKQEKVHLRGHQSLQRREAAVYCFGYLRMMEEATKEVVVIIT